MAYSTSLLVHFTKFKNFNDSDLFFFLNGLHLSICELQKQKSRISFRNWILSVRNKKEHKRISRFAFYF